MTFNKLNCYFNIIMKQWKKYIIENRSSFLHDFHLMEKKVIEACKIAEKEGKEFIIKKLKK